MFANGGIDLSGALMAGWVGKCAKLLGRLSDAIRDHVFDGSKFSALQRGYGRVHRIVL